MVLLFKNGQICGVDKELLKALDADLHDLSQIVNQLEFEIASLKNESLIVKEKSLYPKKIELLSTEDIEVFEVTLSSQTLSQEPQIIPQEQFEEELPQIQPQEEIPIITPQEQFEPVNEELTLKEIEPTIKPLEEVTSEQFPEINEPQIQEEKPVFEETLELKEPEFEMPQPEALQTPEIPETPAPEELVPVEKKEEKISLTFEDDLEEVNKILDLPKEKAQELIKEEVKQAAEELGIDESMTKELLQELYQQIDEEKENFKKALDEKDYDKLHKIAHKLKGAALNLRLSKLAFILKNIDEKAKEHAAISIMKELIEKFYKFVDKIHEKSESIAIPEHIKTAIVQTIQNYLETQDEKKFKKDKKYIEKILNRQIDSIEDLQKLIKG